MPSTRVTVGGHTHGVGPVPVITDPAYAPEQQYPGSTFFEWESCPARKFATVTESVSAFKAQFTTMFLRKLAARAGRLRIKVTIEWLPTS